MSLHGGRVFRLHLELEVDCAAGEFRAVEFGGLPLRSFGDVVKHAAHGLAGALVIGPEGSRVCDDDQRVFPGGTSRMARQTCTRNPSPARASGTAPSAPRSAPLAQAATDDSTTASRAFWPPAIPPGGS